MQVDAVTLNKNIKYPAIRLDLWNDQNGNWFCEVRSNISNGTRFTATYDNPAEALLDGLKRADLPS